ncbi:integrase catalytic domain-containing protein [Trichonephila clavipes]|nr:integrase catalytic domain-containing protein [Trichonephila clavipes]
MGIFRFYHNSKSVSKVTGPLYTHELETSIKKVVKLLQNGEYHTELNFLKCNKPLPKSSKLQSYNVFLDSEGILRVGGRLRLQQTLKFEQKLHLLKTLKATVLNFEELATILCQIKACINSRPLYPLSSDPKDLQVLTPGHFLIGCPLLELPVHSLTNQSLSIHSRWFLLMKLKRMFWSRWQLSYLNTLQFQTKRMQGLMVGSLVLIKNPASFSTRWLHHLSPPPQFRHGTGGEGNIFLFPALVVSAVTAHKAFGPTDLMSTYSVCTWRVFGGIGHRTHAFRSGVRCSNH